MIIGFTVPIEAMNDGIFYNGLENKPDDLAINQLLFNAGMEPQSFPSENTL